jgi:hypothetical protein
MAFIGPASKGPINTPAAFGRTTDLSLNFGDGPTVEAAGYVLTNTGKPVVIVRAETGATVPPSVGEVTQIGPGTAILTADASSAPEDDYGYAIRVVAGGTLGTDPIQYQVSLDDGYNYGPYLQLEAIAGPPATATIIIGATTFNVAAGTMPQGTIYKATAIGPSIDGVTLAPALDALGLSQLVWDQVVIVGDVTPELVGAIDLKIKGFAGRGKYRSWLGSARVPEAEELESEYLADLSAAYIDAETVHGTVCAGAARVISGVSGRNYRRPVVFAVAGAQAAASEEINTADVNIGALDGVSVRDRNGNIIEHDESATPGLDDARFCVLRTWDGYPGVYINRPRLMAAPGSDFQIIPYRRVMNLGEAVLRNYFIRRLNRPIRVDTSTGFILEADALEIEGGATNALRSALLAKPKASGVQFTLSRTDNVLSTKTITGTARLIPLAYPEFVEVQIGFYNPAMAFAA